MGRRRRRTYSSLCRPVLESKPSEAPPCAADQARACRAEWRQRALRQGERLVVGAAVDPPLAGGPMHVAPVVGAGLHEPDLRRAGRQNADDPAHSARGVIEVDREVDGDEPGRARQLRLELELARRTGARLGASVGRRGRRGRDGGRLRRLAGGVYRRRGRPVLVLGRERDGAGPGAHFGAGERDGEVPLRVGEVGGDVLLPRRRAEERMMMRALTG